MDQQLNIPTLPLFGRRLIEASAGTGKTFTIAALYVRLILGHGNEYAYQRPLMPNEILVVTFTKAATEELRERIRNRLKEARDALLGHREPDAVLKSLLIDIPEAELPARARQLDNAVRMMDDAAIFTIHGFCQRMLKRHAFDSGSPFDIELTADANSLLEQAVEDYWRRHYYPLSNSLQKYLSSLFQSPEALCNAIRIPLSADVEQRLYSGDVKVEVPASIGDILNPLQRRLDDIQEFSLRLKQMLDIQGLTQQLFDYQEKGAFKGNMIKANTFAVRLEALEKWMQSDDAKLPSDLVNNEKGQCLLGARYLKSAIKNGFDFPENPFFDSIDEFYDLYSELTDPTPALIAHALDAVIISINEEKRRQGILGYDDLLSALDEALESPMGGRLAAGIRRELPIALIDEFQDTDARQYRIFDHIYPSQQAFEKDRVLSAGGMNNAYALLLIGDPKQAIYAFRNADLATYLKARESVDGLYTLGRNFRSSKAVVQAVNDLFSARENPFIEEELAFSGSEAQGRDESLIVDETVLPAITWWLPEVPDSVSAPDYMRMMSEATRADIQRLLEGARDKRVGFGQKEGTLRPLQASDIAILVRTGGEAIAVREALEQGGIKSVYLSQKASVFQTHEAFWLLQLVEAVAEPRQDRLLRSALMTRLLSDDLGSVESLVSDERYWETMVERFQTYHGVWQQRGILAMVWQVMRDFNISARLLARSGGERSLTDFLHLVELLQGASQVLEGEQALLRWLHRALDGSFDQSVDPDSLIQRLESDESLVRVVTIHGSKGLEYPMVYLPFACQFKETKSSSDPLVIHHPEHGRIVSLTPDSEQRAVVDRARLAEDTRLLYVALTRARYACRVGVASLYKSKRGKKMPPDVTHLNKSALGYLLAGGDAILGHQLPNMLTSIDHHEGMKLEEPPSLPDHAYQPDSSLTLSRVARPFHGHIEKNWWIASYTSLAEGVSRKGVRQDDDVVASSQIDIEVLNESSPTSSHSLGHINDFPRGPQAGTFLHGLLEMVDFARLQDQSYLSDLKRLISHRLERSRFDNKWSDTLYDWLIGLLDTPLVHESGTVRFTDLAAWRTEMEFWLSVVPVYAQQIDRLIRQHHPLAALQDYPALAPRQLHGMLRGFIDMVAEADGRWFILDWKSNFLGDDAQSYSERYLTQAIIEHRYDVQYVLYTLALHRLLKTRLPNYEYEQHIGGIFYLFLRGVSPEQEGLGIFHRRVSSKLIEELDTLLSVREQPSSSEEYAG